MPVEYAINHTQMYKSDLEFNIFQTENAMLIWSIFIRKKQLFVLLTNISKYIKDLQMTCCHYSMIQKYTQNSTKIGCLLMLKISNVQL